jgi:RNA polymerase sigma-70 factor (ECF subfamily)
MFRRHVMQLVQYCSSVGLENLPLSELWRNCVDQPANEPAWDELSRRIRPAIARIACRLCNRWNTSRKQEIEDVIQDIWLKVMEHARGSRAEIPGDDEGALAYLRALAANAARDSLRHRFAAKRGQELTSPLVDRHELLARQIGSADMEAHVLFCQVRDLLEGSDRDRAIFWLYYRQGFTAKEIAAMPATGLTPKGVESLVYRMVSALRDRVAAVHVSLPKSHLAKPESSFPSEER